MQKRIQQTSNLNLLKTKECDRNEQCNPENGCVGGNHIQLDKKEGAGSDGTKHANNKRVELFVCKGKEGPTQHQLLDCADL